MHSVLSQRMKVIEPRYISASDALSGSVNSLNVSVNVSPGFTCLDPQFLLGLVQSFLTLFSNEPQSIFRDSLA